MTNNNSNSKNKIAKNTILLYFRMMVLMVVTLYTSRVVLNTLGVEDYGIYNVVAGFVSMFGIISGALSAAVSRFLNIEMGKGDNESLKLVFSSAVIIHVIIAVILIILAEAVGPWFIANKMTIPLDRVTAALWVFHCSVLVLAINLISIPYNACIVAHENMSIYAYISILEAALRLIIVFILPLYSFDKLTLYGCLMLMVAIIIRIIYQVYCRKNYRESKVLWHVDKNMVRKLFGFASWNMLGSSSVIFADQGVNVLINIFCGPLINAARGLSMQVNSAISQFSNSFVTAINPQITQNYGASHYNEYYRLIMLGSKFAAVLLTMIVLPLLLETHTILNIWLENVPDNTEMFVKLVILYSVSEVFSSTLTTGLLAGGNIKKLMLMVAGLRILNFPISLILLYFTHSAELTFIVSIVLSQLCLYCRLCLLQNIVTFKKRTYYSRILLPILSSFLVTYLTVMLIHKITSTNDILDLFVGIITSIVIYVILVYNFVLEKSEKCLINGYIRNYSAIRL